MIIQTFQHLLSVIVLLVFLFPACRPVPANKDKTDLVSDGFDEQLVVTAVTEKVWAFHSADTARNAQGVVDLLWPDFTMLVDGHRTNYNEVAKGSSDFMKTLDVFHTEWTDLQIIPISANAALSSFLFRDSIVTKTGDVTRAKGPNTFLWERRDGEWKVLYADADHYPVTD